MLQVVCLPYIFLLNVTQRIAVTGVTDIVFSLLRLTFAHTLSLVSRSVMPYGGVWGHHCSLTAPSGFSHPHTLA